MGNSPQTNASSLLVQHSHIKRQKSASINFTRYFSEQKLRKPYFYQNKLRQYKKIGEQFKSKLKTPLQEKQKCRNEKYQSQKNLNLNYFCIRSVQKKSEENSAKQMNCKAKQNYMNLQYLNNSKKNIFNCNKNNNQRKSISILSKDNKRSPIPTYMSFSNKVKTKRIIGIKESLIKKIQNAPLMNNQQICMSNQKHFQKSSHKIYMPIQSHKQKLKEHTLNNLQQSNKCKQQNIKVHQFYFTKSRFKQDPLKKITQQSNSNNLHIPLQSHKNPIGKHRLIINDRRNQKEKNINKMNEINSQNKEIRQIPNYLHFSDNIKNLQIKSEAQNIKKDKQYSICEDSQLNLWKISLKQIESQIKMGFQEQQQQITNFILEQSVIIRGLTQ